MSKTKQYPKSVDHFHLGCADAKAGTRRSVPKYAKKAYQNGYTFGQQLNKAHKTKP